MKWTEWQIKAAIITRNAELDIQDIQLTVTVLHEGKGRGEEGRKASPGGSPAVPRESAIHSARDFGRVERIKSEFNSLHRPCEKIPTFEDRTLESRIAGAARTRRPM